MNFFKQYIKAGTRTGFTLIEAMMASILIGIVIVALMMSNAALTTANGAGMDLSTAEFLIEEIKGLIEPLAVVDPETATATFGAEAGETLANYDDLDDFASAVFSPPIDIARQSLTNFLEFSQQVTVENVSNTNLQTIVDNHSSDFVRITTRILINGNEISSASWIRARI